MSFLSTISNARTLRFMVLKKAIDAPTHIRFFTRLYRDAGKTVSIILDNLNVHTACAVRDWLAEHVDAIEVFYLPSHSPALNPDEYLTGDLKVSVAKRAPARDRDSLLRTATSRPRSRQQRPDQVKTFFQHPRVWYAA